MLAVGLLVPVLLAGGRTAAEGGASIPDGSWTGSISAGWTINLDIGGMTWGGGSGPIIFDSVGGAVTGTGEFRAEIGSVIPGAPTMAGRIEFTTELTGSSMEIVMRNTNGAVTMLTPATSPFPFSSAEGGSLSVDHASCTTVSGRLNYPIPGVDAANSVGTFSSLRASWGAMKVGDVLGVERWAELRVVMDRVDALALGLRSAGAAVDRPAILAAIGELERAVAAITATDTCLATDWTTPLAGSALNLLDAALSRSDISALDLQFLTETAIRTRAVPTADGSAEADLVEVLNARLDQAIAAGDVISAQAVFMAASLLGDADLATRAQAAGGLASVDHETGGLRARRTATAPPDTSPAPITLTSPTTAAGERPTLAWTSAPGAVEYVVGVIDANGRPLWAWRGAEPTVPLGADLATGQEGPRLFDIGTVVIFGVGADGALLSMSGPLTISPT